MGIHRKGRTAILLALLGILPAAVRAQTPTGGLPACDSAAGACSAHAGMPGMKMGDMDMDMGMDMRMMAAADARLDSLVTRMHAATGGAKVGAMEHVIDELLAQRKTMQAHMMRMHEGMPGAGGKDSSDHSGHH